MLGGARRARGRRRARARSRPTPPTRTCTPRSSAGWSSGSAPSAASCAPAVSRNDQVATDLRLYLRDHARPLAGCRRRRCSRRCSTRPSAHVDAAAPGFTHLQHAQPVSFGHELAKHVHALARDVDRLRGLGPARGVLAAGRRRARRLVAAAGPARPSRPSSASTGAVAQLDRRRSATATSPPSSCSSRRWSACTSRGSARRSACGRRGSSAGPSSTTPSSTGSLDHAAEEEPRRRRARPRQGRPADRPPHRRCSRRSRACRSPTTATCRRTRSRSFDAVDTLLLVLPALTGMRRDAARSTPSADGRGRARGLSPSRPTSPSGWSARACRSARRTRSPAPACARPRRAASTSPTSTDADLAADLAAPHAGGADVLTVEGALAAAVRASAARRPVRVREQLAALRADARRRGLTPAWARGPDRLSLQRADTPDRPCAVLRPADPHDGRARRCSGATVVRRRRRRGRGPAHRGRGVRRRRRPRLARLPRPHPAQRRDVRPGRASSTSTSPTACTGAPTSCAGPDGTASAVLLRAGEVVGGSDVARGAPAGGARRPRARARAGPAGRGARPRPARSTATDLLDPRSARCGSAGHAGSRTPRSPAARPAGRAVRRAAGRRRGGSGSDGDPTVSPYRAGVRSRRDVGDHRAVTVDARRRRPERPPCTSSTTSSGAAWSPSAPTSTRCAPRSTPGRSRSTAASTRPRRACTSATSSSC